MSTYHDDRWGRFSMSDLAVSKLEGRLSSSFGSTSLNLGDGFIGDEGCQMVVDFLRDNSNIQNIDLRGNNISAAGLRMLVPALKPLSELRVLSLEWNNLENSVGFLAEALTFHSNLKLLDLRNNKIGPEGVASIGKLIENNTSIERIDLRWNEIGPSGARALISALRKPHKLQSLELSGNRIPEDLLQEARSLLGVSDLTIKSPQPEDNIIAKYESTLVSNARQEARINELEFLFDQESKRSGEMREELIRELEAEKSRRMYAEEALAHAKEEIYHQGTDFTSTQQELEAKLAKTLTDKAQTRMELESIQDQYNKLNYTMQEKTRTLEDKLAQQQRSYRQLDESSKQSYDRLKQEHLEEIEDINRDHELQLTSASDTIQHLKSVREDLAAESKDLRIQLTKLRTSHQEALGLLESSIRQEESDKYSKLIKTVEGRLQTVEDSRDGLSKKNTDLQRQLIESEQESSTKVLELEKGLNDCREEIAALQREIAKFESENDSLKTELNASETTLKRVTSDKEDLNRVMQEREQTHMKKLESLYQEQTIERQESENTKKQLMQKVASLEGELAQALKERDRSVKEYENLQQSVQQRLLATIEECVTGHLRKLQSSF